MVRKKKKFPISSGITEIRHLLVHVHFPFSVCAIIHQASDWKYTLDGLIGIDHLKNRPKQVITVRISYYDVWKMQKFHHLMCSINTWLISIVTIRHVIFMSNGFKWYCFYSILFPCRLYMCVCVYEWENVSLSICVRTYIKPSNVNRIKLLIPM